MKIGKVLFLSVLVISLGFGWYKYINGILSRNHVLAGILASANESMNNRLYEQAIEYYKEAFELDRDMEHYLSIHNAYRNLYNEEINEAKITMIRNGFISDLRTATRLFPNEDIFWETLIELRLEQGRTTTVYQLVQEAKRNGVINKFIDSIYNEIKHTITYGNRTYNDFQTSLNGFYSVLMADGWYMINEEENFLLGPYEYVSLPSDNKYNIVVSQGEVKLLDANQITRGRYNENVDGTGIYASDVQLFPLKSTDGWVYINIHGERIPGIFEEAGSFYNNMAAVKLYDKWFIIDNNGKIITETGFDDIKLGLDGSYLHEGLIIAKNDGKYRLYDENLSPIGNFNCDDIDISIKSGLIAFSDKGLWGFVDKDGNIIKEPTYIEARSFSNGFAAVRNNDAWGYINSDFDLIVDYQFDYAHYFINSNTSMVGYNDTGYKLLKLPYY